MDPFLRPDEDESVHRSVRHGYQNPKSIAEAHSFEVDSAEPIVDFTVQGQRKEVTKIFLKLRIADSSGLPHYYLLPCYNFVYTLLHPNAKILFIDPGRVQNIHFPFDTESDTPASVAGEMVEELDLTDQDISTIADMIESEIRKNFPEWTPEDVSGYNFDEQTPFSGSWSSEMKDGASPLASQSSPLKALALERLPSGRKYWSDSPKGNSPVTPGPSSLSSPGAARSLTEENEVNDDPDSDMRIAGEIEADIKTVAEKAKTLLVKQRKELDGLKNKHRSEMSDLLNGISPEARQRVLELCNAKIPDCEIQN